MADTPPGDESPEDRFLAELWQRLDRAGELSSGADAMLRLEEVLQLCEDAAAMIRGWRDDRN